jgi:tetratricopeptide (TPR) repeat protein
MLCCLAVLLAASLPILAEELPPELSFIDQAKDEAGLVKAVRDFDKAQLGAAGKEQKEAESLAQAGKAEEAKTQLQSARARAELVRKAYEAALKRYESNARLQNYYGELLYDIYGDFTGAIKCWETAVSIDPKLGAAYNNLGLHYFHSGSYELGLHNMDEALRLDPKHPDYCYNMAQLYLVHGPQIEKMRGWKPKKVYRRAMAYSHTSVHESPNDYDLLMDYANNFYAAERFSVKADWKKAAKAWQQARAKARTEEERFYCFLNEGRVWLFADKKEKAEGCLLEAQRMRPESEPVKSLLLKAQKK